MRRRSWAGKVLAGCAVVSLVGAGATETASPAGASNTPQPQPQCSLVTCTVVFDRPGLGQSWTVPPGATSETFTLYGAVGGRLLPDGALPETGSPGDGAEVTGSLNLSPGAVVTIDVGGAGGVSDGYPTAGGINGGGAAAGGPGGGGTDIRVSHVVALEAGGGGGGGGEGTAGPCAEPSGPVQGGDGGNADSPGATGASYAVRSMGFASGGGGGAGTISQGGAGGQRGTAINFGNEPPSCQGSLEDGNSQLAIAGQTGASFLGGTGGQQFNELGGGGGGGYTGGGGGGSEVIEQTQADNPRYLGQGAAGGGGGGASAGPHVSNYALVSDTANRVGHPAGDATGDGEALITYTQPLIGLFGQLLTTSLSQVISLLHLGGLSPPAAGMSS